MLAKAGSIIISSIRENVDTAFRYGGDEFAVILVEAEHDTTLHISQRLKEGFAKAGTMRASVGLATYTKNMKVNDLIELADRNLYKGKLKNGKQRI